MKALLKLLLGMGARKGLASYPNSSCCDTRMAILNIEPIKDGLKSN
jgi:hypothetical protein